MPASIESLRNRLVRSDHSPPDLDDLRILQMFYPQLVIVAARKRRDEMVKHFKGELVLDTGCGSGWLAADISRRGYSVIAHDLSERSIQRSLALFRVEDVEIPLLRASLTHLPFRESLFDSIVCCEVIEHVPDLALALSELHRVLKRSGRLCMTTPNGYGSWGIIYDIILPGIGRGGKGIEERHVHRFTSSRLRRIIEKRGFRVLKFFNLEFLTPLLAFVFCGLLRKERPFIKMLEKLDIYCADKVPLILGGVWVVICEKQLSVKSSSF